MSAVMARSPASADFAMYPSATSRPIATRTVETCREGGNRMVLLATKIALTSKRSAARMTISFTAAGQASASTKILMGPRYVNLSGSDTAPTSRSGKGEPVQCKGALGFWLQWSPDLAVGQGEIAGANAMGYARLQWSPDLAVGEGTVESDAFA